MKAQIKHNGKNTNFYALRFGGRNKYVIPLKRRKKENVSGEIDKLLYDELTTRETCKLVKISENLDKGAGNRFYSRQEFLHYQKR